jgi:hypothetical protein
MSATGTLNALAVVGLLLLVCVAAFWFGGRR